MMIPLVTRTTEEMVRARADVAARGGARARLPALAHVAHDRAAHRARRASSPARSSPSRASPARRRRCSSPRSATSSGRRRSTQPIAALPLQIFTYAISPYDDWHAQAWAGALVLIGSSSSSASSRASPRAPGSARRRLSVAIAPSPSAAARPARQPRMRRRALNAYLRRACTPCATSSLDVPRSHEVTAIIGPSGCGKSTLLRCLNRMHETVPGARVEGAVHSRRPRHLRRGVDPIARAPARRHGVPAADAVPDDVDSRQRRGRLARRSRRHGTRDASRTRSSSTRCGAPRCGTR